MKKIFWVLLCAVCLTFTSCDLSKLLSEIDDLGIALNRDSAEFAVKYYLNDSLLQYMDVAIVDELHPGLGNLSYTVSPIDTLNADKAIWVNGLGTMYYHVDTDLYQRIPVSSIKVLAVTRGLSADTCYNYSIHFTRNQMAAHSDSLDLLTTSYCYSDYKMWKSELYISTVRGVEMDSLVAFMNVKEQALSHTFVIK